MRLLRWLSRGSLFTNSAYNLVAILSTALFGFVFWLVGARLYPSSDIGAAQIVISAMFGIAAISLLGFNFAIPKFFPDEKEKEMLLGSCLFVSVLVALLGSGVFALLLDFVLTPQGVFRGALFSAAFALITASWSVGAIMDSFFIAVGDSRSLFVRNMIINVAKLCTLFLGLYLGSKMLFFSWGAGSVLSIAAMLFFLPNIRRFFIPAFSAPLVRKILPLSAGNYFSWGFNYVVALIGLPILATYWGLDFVGYFGIAWSIATVLFIVSSSLSQVLIAEAANSPQSTPQLVRKSLKYSFAFLIPAFIATALLRSQVLSFFGPAYPAASDALLVLAFSSLPLALVNAYIAQKSISNNAASIMAINGARLAGFVLCALALTQQYGMVGTAAAWLFANLAICPFAIAAFFAPAKAVAVGKSKS